MNRRAAWIVGLVFGGLFLCLFAFVALAWVAIQSGRTAGLPRTGPRIGVVEVTGPIADAKQTVKELREFGDSDGIRAVVVRVDSPGGAVGPSQEIYDAVKRLRDKKHVVVSMGSIAASGGFYIACAGEQVFANPGTLTGSIGVIFQFPNVSGLAKWAGVSINTLTAGKMKDVGSPFREMTAEERTYFLGMLEDVHGQFIGAVAAGRKLPEDEVRKIADGRVFTGRAAKDLKLVDQLGGLEDAVREAAKLAGVSGEPRMEYPRKERPFVRELLGEDAETLVRGLTARVEDVTGRPGIQLLAPGFGAAASVGRGP